MLNSMKESEMNTMKRKVYHLVFNMLIIKIPDFILRY